jgi:NADH pyrophosphatase NudC (nudix superfamily)
MAEPTFIPRPGQVDFTHIRYAPVINTIVMHVDKILLVQRSSEMRLYPDFWNGIPGFLDDDKSIEEKIYEELREELGIGIEDIASLRRGQALVQEAPKYGKTWLVVPHLVEVRTTSFTLDWEASRAKWFTPMEAKELALLPSFLEVLTQFFPTELATD